MLQFVDSFYCAFNQAKNNFFIRFRQEEPCENSDTGEVTIQTNEVVNLMLDSECAHQLASSILNLLEQTPLTEDDTDNAKSQKDTDN